MKKILPIAFLGAAALIFPVSVKTIFLETPIEQQMGTVQKIFYFHVPLAWIMMLLAIVCSRLTTRKKYWSSLTFPNRTRCNPFLPTYCSP